MAIEYLTASAGLEKIVSVIDRDGCVILTGLVPPGKIDAIESELEPFMSRTPNCEGHFWGWNTRRCGGLLKKTPSCHDLVSHDLITGAADRILGEYCDRIQLNLSQAMRIYPGEKEQVLHGDDEVFPIRGQGMELIFNTLWAIDDFTVENGATRLVPGSHKVPLNSDEQRFPDPSLIEYAEMERGSVLLYRTSVLHGGGANKSNAPRTGIAFGYSLGWLRQAENQYLTYPPEIARKFPEKLQELIGYKIQRPNLGWYEGQDPSIALKGPVDVSLATKDYLPPETEALLQMLDDAA